MSWWIAAAVVILVANFATWCGEVHDWMLMLSCAAFLLLTLAI